MGHNGRWKSDVSRVETGVSQLNGPTLPEGATSFTGKGVTVCLIDEGFDFQHPAFKDANGNSRIKCVYMLTDEGGRKFTVDDPEIGEYTFPGSVYDTPELIATLTTDDDEEYHGSHTAGIAAGSLSPQGFGGMAPEADLVLISLSGDFDEYEDVNDVIELAISFAVAYAQQNDQPVVLSCSANSHSGPHDGTSTVTKAIEEASQTLVPVFSAGNEGGYPVHLYQKFTETKKTIKTLLIGLMDSETDGYIYDMMASVAGYTRTGSEASITGALKTLWSSDTFTATPDCEEAVTLVSSDDDATLAKYFKGELAVGAFDNGDGRLCIGAEVDGSVKGLYLFQLTIGGAPNTEIDLWDDVAGFGGTQLIGLPGYVDGDKAMLQEVTGSVPAGEGLILMGSQYDTFEIPYAAAKPAAVSNMLNGVLKDTKIGGDGLDYVLYDGAFAKAGAGTLKAGKAYLKLDAALGRDIIKIGDVTTGISEKITVNSGTPATVVYNLNGQRVSKPSKGIYVLDGKKAIKQ